MNIYTVQLRSGEPDQLGPETEREFGGAAPRQFLYRFNTVEFRASDDEEAVGLARKEARKRKMIVVEVKKVIYRSAFCRKRKSP